MIIVSRNFLATLMIVGILFFASVADAEIRVYTATAEESASAFEPEEIVKLHALDKAIKLATEQASIDLKNNFANELSDDDISAIVCNGYEFGEVQYNLVGKAWQAATEIKIDDAEVKDWIRRDDREKFVLMNQTSEERKLFEANNNRVEKLRKRAENISKREEKKFFKAEFAYVNNEFLSNRKVAEGNKFAWRGRLDDAINLYTEAIELNEYNAAAYNRRGNLYNVLAMNQKNIPIAESNRRMSLNDLDKAIRLNQNYSEAFGNRGFVYYNAKLFGQAIKDFNRAIQLEPNTAQNYIYRALCYRQTDSNSAFADFNKAVELAPNAPYTYSNRGNFYEYDLKDYRKALADYTRAIELDKPEASLVLNYDSRGGVYRKLNMYDKAIEDYTRAISLLESQTQRNPLLPWIYRKRGECYQAFGDGAKAQADLNKFGELQRQ